MQVAFFAVTDLMSFDDAVAAVMESIEHAYGKRGGTIVAANHAAVAATLPALYRMDVPADVTADHSRRAPVPTDAPDFVSPRHGPDAGQRGRPAPVSAMPVDGEFPTATSRYEKRRLATEIPVWDPSICIDLRPCALVCPHAAIRVKIYDPAQLDVLGAADLPTKAFRSKDHPGLSLTVQVTHDDCTGCGVCVDVCPARSKSVVKHKAIDMLPRRPRRPRGRPTAPATRSSRRSRRWLRACSTRRA